MRKSYLFASLLGVGLTLVPFTVLAQDAAAPAAQAAPVTPADEQPTAEQLAKLFEVMRVKDQLASVTKIMPAMMQQQFSAQAKQMQKDHPEMATMTPQQQEAMAKVTGKFVERAMNLYTSDEMVADMSALYQKHLSRSDVDGMIVFYSSPAGQHMLDMVPVIMKEFMPVVMQRVQSRAKPLSDEMEKEMREIAKPANPPAPKPAQN
jgi:hypothetical protein